MTTRTLAGAVSLAASLALTAGARAGDVLPRPAPAIEVHGADGAPIRLADLKGKVVLVDFWASWCGPCKQSFPALDALYREVHSRGVEVLAINVDENRKDADAFLSGRAHAMTLAFDPKGKSPQAFGVEAMPSSFLIDRSGTIRFAHSGFKSDTPLQYRMEIDALLAEGQHDGE